jgi:type IV pilus assembly protein PilY1
MINRALCILTRLTRFTRRTWLRSATLVGASLVVGWALAQTIDDIPPAVKNNVAPNFMFMIDNSGSMSNIVPTSPFSVATTYLASCPGGSTVSTTDQVSINIGGGGVPRFDVDNNTYKHTTDTAPSGNARRCFDPTGIYTAALLDPVNNYLPAQYTGNFLNWYFGTYAAPNNHPLSGWTNGRKMLADGSTVQTRIEIAQTSAKSVIAALPLPLIAGASAAVRVGLTTYDSDGGALKVAMGDLTTTTKATLNTKIDALAPTGMTPLASTFADIGRYMATGYVGNVTTANSPSVDLDALLRLSGDDNSARPACLSGAPSCTSANSVKPIQYWCQRSSVFAMTDGRPQGDRSFNNNTYIRDYDKDCSGVNAASCVSNGAAGAWDRKIARTYESLGSDYMDDVAKVLFDIDLRPDLIKPAPVAPATRAKNNLTTYMIGFADLAVQNDPLLINTAKQGGGKFIAASDGPALVSAFQRVIADALAKDASSAAVAVTNTQVTVGSVSYASSYNSGSWFGDLEAFSVDLSTGLQTGAAHWSARDKLTALSPISRKIASYNGSVGVGFNSANASSFPGIAPTAPMTAAGLINYVRGDRTAEDTTYRARTYLLGDIINAEPVVVNYPTTGVTLFQAANDGMLHAFDGRIDANVTTAGQELWAYVPRLIHSNLPSLASMSFQHKYLVDSTPATAQITGAGTMTRILVGGLGKGGAGYYALDVTTSAAATEADVASKVKWEFKPANMGYSFGTPLIVNTSAGWRVVVTSGYRNDTASGGLGGDGRGHVWLLNPSTGAVDKEFVTPAGFGSSSASLGLAHLGKMANVAADAATHYVYAGDLLGNVWRIDLDAASLSAPVRIAAVTAPNGIAQPVTVPPVIGSVSGSTSKVYVYVGTGQYLSVNDVPGSASANSLATQTQTMYGIVDDTSVAAPLLPTIRGTNGATCPVGGGNGDLVCQAATQTSTASAFTATFNTVSLSVKRGFYMDIPLVIGGGRVNTQAGLTTKGTLVFVVNQPSNVICDPGGNSYFFQLSAATGGAIVKNTSGNTYFNAGYMLANALSSRVVFNTTTDGTRGNFRLSDKTTQSRIIDETLSSSVLFKRIYKRALN